MSHSFLKQILTNPKRLLSSMLLLILLFVLMKFIKDVPAGIENVTSIKENKSFSCIYQDVEHKFNVFLPENTDRSTHYPLIIMLHGYGNTSESFASQTHFERNACEKGYVVAYITSTPDSKGYIGWNSGLDDSDKDDVGFITALTSYLQEQYHCDKNRTFVVGFSNGAFMTQRLAVDASDKYTAIASVSGMMPKITWEKRQDRTNISILEIYGTKDDVIPMKSNGSDQTSINPAIEDVMEYWASANNLSNHTEDVLSERSLCTKYANSENTNFVWTVTIQDGRHSWPEQSYAGFSTNELILTFFDQF